MKRPTTTTKKGAPELIEEVFSTWFEGVQRGLEMPNSALGDNLSDSYKQLIDLATEPSNVPDRVEKIERRLCFLKANESYIDACVARAAELYDSPDLQKQYASILAQIAIMYGNELPAESQV